MRTVARPRDDGPREATKFQHVPGLDGLHAVAVLLVIGTHLLLVFHPSRYFDWVAGGFLGVELFFVLSGFLITTLLIGERERSGRLSLLGFYRRRALRLLPALVVLLLAHLVYAAVTGLDLGLEVRTALESLFYVSNWFIAAGHPFVTGLEHLWSLSVEEQFYVVWPVLLVGILAWSRSRRAMPVIIAAAALLLTLETSISWHPGTSFFKINSIYMRTDLQAVCLLSGALAALLWRRGHLPPRRVLSLLASAASVFIVVCAWHVSETAGFYYRGGLLLIGIAAALVVLAIVEGTWPLVHVMAWAPLRAIGQVSYGLYLWHLPVFFAVSEHGGSLALGVQILVALALTTLCTIASWYLVEKPFLRRKRSRRPAAIKFGGVSG